MHWTVKELFDFLCGQESFLCSGVQASSVVHSVSYSVSTAALSPAVLWPEQEADYFPPSSKVKNEWGYASTPLYVFMACTGKLCLCLHMHNKIVDLK
jgi:hypothetical protein